MVNCKKLLLSFYFQISDITTINENLCNSIFVDDDNEGLRSKTDEVLTKLKKNRCM